MRHINKDTRKIATAFIAASKLHCHDTQPRHHPGYDGEWQQSGKPGAGELASLSTHRQEV